jgi:hypothetical protein
MAAVTNWNASQLRQNSQAHKSLSRAPLQVNYWAIAGIVYSAVVWGALAAWLF